MSKRAIAITGAGGFIGSKLVAALRGAGEHVVEICRADQPFVSSSRVGMNLEDRTQIDAVIEAGFRADVLIHLAGHIQIMLPGSTTAGPPPPDIARLYSANVLATANMVDLAYRTGVARIIFASSQTVYGFGENGQADEDTPVRPLEHYALTKVCGESLLRLAATGALGVTVLRFPGIFSPGRRRGAVYQMCRTAVLDGRIRLELPAPVPFDVLALDDVVSGIMASRSYAGGVFRVFNLSADQPNSLELLAARIARLRPGVTVERSGVPQPELRMIADRARQELGWRAMSPDERLEEMMASITA